MKTCMVVGVLAVVAVLLLTGQCTFAKDVTLGVVWEGESSMTNSVVQGLSEVLAAKAPQIQVEWQKNQPKDQLDPIIKRFQQEKSGMAVLRSSGAQYLAKNPPTIPAFIGGCNNPQELGAVKNLEKPEGNITGVTYFVPYDQQFKTFKALLPKFTTILLLVEKGHPSSEIDRAGTKAICATMGITYNEAVCSTADEITAAIKQYKDSVSAIIMGTQAVIFDNTAAALAAAGNTPVLSYSSKPVKQGVLCGLAADDVKLGRMLGESIIDVLVNGKQIKDIPVKVDMEPKLSINVDTAQKIGVTVPMAMLKVANVVSKTETK